MSDGHLLSDGHFLHCRECGALFRPSPYDRVPEFLMTADGYTEIARDDCMAFLARHARHPLETLRLTGDASAHEGPLWDPMARGYWQVSNGTEPFVVEGWRDHVAQPLQYRLVAGRLVAERVAVEIPEDEIREQVDRALYPGVARERNVTAFVERFKAVVWQLDPASLEVLYDLPDDPTLGVAKLPALALTRLALHASQIFDRTDSARIDAHLAATAGDPDAFTVLVRRRVRIER